MKSNRILSTILWVPILSWMLFIGVDGLIQTPKHKGGVLVDGDHGKHWFTEAEYKRSCYCKSCFMIGLSLFGAWGWSSSFTSRVRKR